MPSTVTPDDAVSRCSPYCVLKLYLTKKGGEGKNGFRRKASIFQFFFLLLFFLIYINSNLFGAVRKREIKDVFLIFYFIFVSFSFFFFSFVALNCASSRDGCVGSAVGGQRSCVNGVKWRPV